MHKGIRLLAWGLVALLTVGLGVMIVGWYSQQLNVEQTQSGQTLASVGGDFSMTDHTGKAVTQADFGDKPFVIFFGYTFCPDVCPTTLGELTLWIEELGEDADKLDYLFVTVDPERDDQEAMSDYVNAFTDKVVGLRGNREQTDQIIKAFRVYAKKVEDEDADSNYVLDHTASVFLMKKSNVFSGTISYGEAHESAVAKLRKLIASAS